MGIAEELNDKIEELGLSDELEVVFYDYIELQNKKTKEAILTGVSNDKIEEYILNTYKNKLTEKPYVVILSNKVLTDGQSRIFLILNNENNPGFLGENSKASNTPVIDSNGKITFYDLLKKDDKVNISSALLRNMPANGILAFDNIEDIKNNEEIKKFVKNQMKIKGDRLREEGQLEQIIEDKISSVFQKTLNELNKPKKLSYEDLQKIIKDSQKTIEDLEKQKKHLMIHYESARNRADNEEIKSIEMSTKEINDKIASLETTIMMTEDKIDNTIDRGRGPSIPSGPSAY